MGAATANAAAAANTGRQRELSQSNNGMRNMAGAINDQGPLSTTEAITFAEATTMTARVPSSNSGHAGGSRTAAATPISSGATVIMPSASDANQTCQTSRKSAVEGPSSFIAPAAPMAAIAVAIIATTKKPTTRRSV